MKINVLGTEYDFKLVDEIGPNCYGEMQSGRTDFVKKEILVVNDPNQTTDTLIKHEIMHAVFYESGLIKYSNDEMLVDFIAAQYNKIKLLFEKTIQEVLKK